jgi:hypothetical protein
MVKTLGKEDFTLWVGQEIGTTYMGNNLATSIEITNAHRKRDN